ncbi:putative cytokinetic ring protein SteA [Demequina sp. NBRC 110051]|uniref:putative cytokinetic ring protein SteA n=1 Tax=Demequina sp. NBRC 110051 TaxID=1570340 RepID=UPI00117EF145|nr:putative cytokinetic ring protein SteA [Demequina sp. NBRC 110051]
MSRTVSKGGAGDGTIVGPVRVDHTVTALMRHLRKGDIAVVDVMDLDQRSAEALVSAQPAAVVNARPSISGRYPAGGPRVLLDAGIPLIDAAGPSVLDLKDGATATITGGDIAVADTVVASGTVLDADALVEAMRGAADGMRVQLQMFTANAMEQVLHEGDVLLEGQGLPAIGVDLTGRHVVVVAPGYRHREQLREIRRYLRDVRPVVIAVDQAADAALDLGPAATVLVGDLETMGEGALSAASHAVVHSPRGGDGGRARAEALGIDHTQAESGLSAVDLAILIAHAGGAEVIVTVGVDARLMDFLEAPQGDTAGTFLARLSAGGSLVDATTLALVYRHRFSAWSLIALVAAAFAALGAAIWVTPGGRAWVGDGWTALTSWIGVG